MKFQGICGLSSITVIIAFISGAIAEDCHLLNRAIADGDSTELKQYIEEGADINCKDSVYSDRPLLLEAAYYNKLYIVKFLVHKGADINACDGHGETALHCAAEKGYTEIAEYLVENGANVSARNYAGALPIHKAAYSLNPELITYLNNKRPDLLSERDTSGNTVLHYASKRFAIFNYQEFIRAILTLQAAGADINAQNKDGNTMITYTIIELLNLMCTGSINCFDEFKPASIDEYYSRLIVTLVYYKADVSIKNNEGKSPYSYATINSFPKTRTALIATGKDFLDEDREMRRSRLKKAGENFQDFITEDLLGASLAIGLPLCYLGFSIYTREFSYKNQRDRNWMNGINPFLSMTCTGTITGILVGVAMCGGLKGEGPGLAAAGPPVIIFFGALGTVVGVVAGAVVAAKKPENPFLYYLAPVELSIAIPLVYFNTR